MRVLALLSLFMSACAEHLQNANEDSGGVTSDLASMLQTQPVRQQELFSHALRIIHSMESSPTCNRLAALTLINSCQSLEQAPNDTKRNSELVLDEVKSEYAARLAVCELIGAKANAPRECSILVPSSRACGKFRLKFLFHRQDANSDNELCYPDASHSQFEQCLRALESKPQWWTSYSNARQNAVVMCQASRDAIEREEKLSLYKSLADATSGISTALTKSIEDAQARLSEQMEFLEKVRASQADVMKDIKQSRDEAVYSLHYVTTDMRSAIQSLAKMVSQAFITAKSQADDLDQSIARSRLSFSEAGVELLDLLKSMAHSMKEHTTVQNDQLQLNHESALEVQQAIDRVRSNHMYALSEAIGSLQNDVHLSRDLMAEMYSRQGLLDQRLSDLSGAFGTLESTAANLQTTINETTQAIKLISVFGGLGSVPGIWASILIILLGAWFASRRLAGFLIACSGLLWLAYSTGSHEWLKGSYAALSSIGITLNSILHAHSKALWIILATSILFFLTMAIYLYARNSSLFPYQDERGEKGVLPSIETPDSPATPPVRRQRRFNPFFSF